MSRHLLRYSNTYFELLDDHILDTIFVMMLNDYLIEHKFKFQKSLKNLNDQFFNVSHVLLRFKLRKMLYEINLLQNFYHFPPVGITYELTEHRIKKLFDPSVFLLTLKIKKKFNCDCFEFAIRQNDVTIILRKNNVEVAIIALDDNLTQITHETFSNILRKILRSQY